jgi:DNA-binding NtrC family response regulator
MSLKELEKLVRSDDDRRRDRPIVVVVDDDVLIRNSLETVLIDKYDVRTCANGMEGVRTVDDATSCVILDVRMPTHDGFWVCKHLRKRAPDVPIIFYSAYQDVKDPYEIINEYHPFGYVVKGDTLSTLLSLVASAVRHSARVREVRRTIERLREAREQVRDVHGEQPDGSEPPRRDASSARSSGRTAAATPARPSSLPPGERAPTQPPPSVPPSSRPAPGPSRRR